MGSWREALFAVLFLEVIRRLPDKNRYRPSRCLQKISCNSLMESVSFSGTVEVFHSGKTYNSILHIRLSASIDFDESVCDEAAKHLPDDY